jgi:hypothetical protein
LESCDLAFGLGKVLQFAFYLLLVVHERLLVVENKGVPKGLLADGHE